jgi:hypothetical protein
VKRPDGDVPNWKMGRPLFEGGYYLLNTLENICDKIHFLNIKKLEATYDRLNYNPPQTTP